MDSVEFKVQLAQFAMHPLKRKMVVQTRIEYLVSGIFKHGIFRGDQEKIM